MANQKTPSTAPYRRWAAWIGRLLLIPLIAACGGMLFGLYRFAVTGQLSTVSRNFGPASTTIYFSEHPVWFSVLFVLWSAVTAILIVTTVVMARLFFRQPPPDTQ